MARSLRLLRRTLLSSGASALAACICASPGRSQTAPSDPVLERIRHEAIAGSRLDEDLFRLTDAIGPRVVGSPALGRAQDWVTQRLRDYGLRNVRIEPNPPLDVGGGLLLQPPGWSWNRLTVQQLVPWQQTLIAIPVLYSPPTPGVVAGEVIFLSLPQPSAPEVASFIKRNRGRLKGKFLLISDEEFRIAPSESPGFHHYSAEELDAMARATAPAPPTPAPAGPEAEKQPPPESPPVTEFFKQQSRVYDFLRHEGVLGLIDVAGGNSQGGTLALSPPPYPPVLVAAPPPMFELAPEHFNRVLRLIKHNNTVRLEADLQSTLQEHQGTDNVLGEIPGGDRADETVLVGAHLDSWHGGTGATDNAVGVAVVL